MNAAERAEKEKAAGISIVRPPAPRVQVLDREDAIGFVGVALVVAGIFWIYRPAALIVLGALFVAYALILGQKPKRTPSPKEESD